MLLPLCDHVIHVLCNVNFIRLSWDRTQKNPLWKISRDFFIVAFAAGWEKDFLTRKMHFVRLPQRLSLPSHIRPAVDEKEISLSPRYLFIKNFFFRSREEKFSMRGPKKFFSVLRDYGLNWVARNSSKTKMAAPANLNYLKKRENFVAFV